MLPVRLVRFALALLALLAMGPAFAEDVTFSGLVTGASDKGTYVRLLSPPAEGRVVRGERGMDVGDHVQVRLLNTDPEKGFIDFARV